jgi:integrase
MSKAWVYQDAHQVEKVGAAKASYYVGWFDPEGRKRCQSCGSGAAGRNAAYKLREKRQAELISGTYQSNAKKTWEQFREEYEAKILPGLAVRSRVEVKTAFDHFERIIGPKRLSAIKTSTFDEYTAKRRVEPGKKRGDLVSPPTINKELRHLRAAMRKAHRWGYIASIPYFDLEKEPKKLPTYVSPEHFAMIYSGCGAASLPGDLPYPAADWWRGLVVTAYMTGWRVSELLALRREDVDLDAGTAITRWEDNKGKRDEQVKLHPVVVEHLRRILGFDPAMFPWHHNRRTLQTQFAQIQEAVGIRLPCRGNHEHSRFCYVYGFHDFRRAFATMNADKLSADALQALMRHKSYLTTQKYINMSRQLDAAVAVLHVPEVLRSAAN